MEQLIDNLSEKIAGNISKDKEELEVITYGIHHIFMLLLNFFFVLVHGLIWNDLVFITVTFLHFSILRPYTGGYHAKTEGRCLCLSLVMINLILICKRYFGVGAVWYLPLGLIAVVILILWSPVGTPNKELDALEKAIYGRKARQIIAITVGVNSIAVLLGGNVLYAGITYSLVLSAGLLLAGKWKYKVICTSVS